MKLWLLTYILISSGVHQATFGSETECLDHMLELEIVTKKDLWTAVCQGPRLEYIISSKAKGDIGP